MYLSIWVLRGVSKYIVKTSGIFITGDINIHFDVSTNSHTCHFTEILDSCVLLLYIKVSTHYKGHTLDILANRDTNLLCNTYVVDIDLCVSDSYLNNDHFVVHVLLIVNPY